MERKEFIVILSITVGVIIFWAISDLVFHTDPSIPLDPKIDTLIEPITEEFDLQTTQLINDRVTTINDVPEQTPEVVPPPLDISELESINLDDLTVEDTNEATDTGAINQPEL